MKFQTFANCEKQSKNYPGSVLTLGNLYKEEIKMENKITVKKTKENTFFIVRMEDDKIMAVSGVGNLIKYVPCNLGLSSTQVAASLIVDLNEKEARLLYYHSDDTYSRSGTYTETLTDEYLKDLILYGYDIVYRKNKKDVFIKLENIDYNITINFDEEKYSYQKQWNDGYERAHDKVVLEGVENLQEAILMALERES